MQRTITCLLLILLFYPVFVLAAEGGAKKPLWEVGLVGGAGLTPDYPASDEYHPVGIALPYVRYRGRIFRAGDKGTIARGRFLRGDRYEFDLSVSGSFAADSDDNDARRGMPDLDALLEIGPRFQLTLAQPLPQSQIGFELPIRAVFSVDFDAIGYRGFTFHPRFSYAHDNLFGVISRLKLSLGPIFATEELMDYFYQVKERYRILGERPAFNADAGYLGSEFGLIARRQITRHLNIFAALKVNYYEGATNADSPLFRTKSTAAVGFGFNWIFYQSKRSGVD